MARKTKLIEVAHRARQLGGDQAHAVLVYPSTTAECDGLQADGAERDILASRYRSG